jgi:DUF1680 family protein
VSMQLAASGPRELPLRLRIPAWAQAARIEVNGQRWAGAAEPGTFAEINREWRDGDRIDLELPREKGLEAVDRQHPGIVALLAGPLVLFPVNQGAERPRPTRAELLAAQQVAPRRWEMRAGATAVTLLPYVEIDAEDYSTFVTLAA